MKQTLYIWGLTLLLTLMSSCGTPPVWYKPDKNQTDFDLASRECEFIAQQMADENAMTGHGNDPVEYMKAYNRCLYARGWRPGPQVAGRAMPSPPLAVKKSHHLAAFGKDFSIPAEFQLLHEKQESVGPTTLHSFFFKGRGELYFNLIFQQNVKHAFETVDYPVTNPFFLYHKGEEKRSNFKWSAFVGQFNNEWVTGLGAYRMIGKNQRITFVLTAPLTKDPALPPPGMRITRLQRDEIESFMKTWLPRLKTL